MSMPGFRREYVEDGGPISAIDTSGKRRAASCPATSLHRCINIAISRYSDVPMYRYAYIALIPQISLGASVVCV